MFGKTKPRFKGGVFVLGVVWQELVHSRRADRCKSRVLGMIRYLTGVPFYSIFEAEV